MKILSIVNLKKHFNQGETRLEVLKGINAQFKQGESYAITGVSGTGKSTLIHLVAGLDSPDSGEILFNNKNISQLTPTEKDLFLNKNIGLVFQYPYLIKELSVLENIIIKGLIAGNKLHDCRKKGMDLLKTFNLEEKSGSCPASLSGGQQQRIAILRAIFNRPDFLIADEPTGNLDEKTAREVVNLLIDCQKRWNMGLIISSHDKYVSNNMENVYHIKDGLLIKER